MVSQSRHPSEGPGLLTRRQHEIYDYLRESITRNGYAPSLEEIAANFSLSSVATIHEHLKNLESKNMIRRQFNRNRAIEVLRVAGEPRALDVAVLGRVAAGRPIEALDVPESVALPEEMLGRGETFVLRVQGDSMIDELIRDGDLVVVESRETAENGETVIALVCDAAAANGALGELPHGGGDADPPPGEVTLKKFYREGDRVRLQPANPAVEPLVLREDQVRIQGVVIGVIRKYRRQAAQGRA
ncbi:MAG: repressor LexA [Gemmatimonadetes bacterium]|nr:repressor LexA [Gemmatimonadota bacterium]